jgi:uncharacterized membrane protein YoaK (UPF0700 family)
MIGETTLAAIAIVLAMGAENAIFADSSDVRIGLTYITGTLVKMGQHLARAALGGPKLVWWPYFLLWLGLAAGAVVGAAIYPVLGLNGLWLAAAASLLFAAFARNTDLSHHHPG